MHTHTRKYMCAVVGFVHEHIPRGIARIERTERKRATSRTFDRERLQEEARETEERL